MFKSFSRGAVLKMAGILSVVILLSCGSARAVDLYWDANGSSAGTGGTGNWNTTSALWRNGSATGSLTTWVNDGTANAYFAGAAGTVTLTVGIKVKELRISTSNYVIKSNTLTLAASSKIYCTGNSSIESTIAGSSTVPLVKTDSGTLTLKGNNQYSGGTVVEAGTLTLGHNSALGATSGLLTVKTGGTLNLGGYSPAVTGLSDGSGETGTGAGGTVTTSSASTLTIVEAGTSFGGTISGSVSIVLNAGSGVQHFNGSNTYTGTTTVNADLTIWSASALGSTSGGTTVNSGGVLRMRSETEPLTYAAEPLTFNGTAGFGVSPISALKNATFPGAITLSPGANPTITRYNSGAASLTLGGVIGGSGGFTKEVNNFTLNLNGSNSYSGTTTILGGLVRLGTPTALGVTTSGTVVDTSGMLDLNGKNINGEPLTIEGTGVSEGGALVNTSAFGASGITSLTLTGNVVVSGSANINMSASGVLVNLNGYTLTKNGSNTLDLLNGTITNGNITANAGKLTLRGNVIAQGSGTLTFGPASTVEFILIPRLNITRPMLWNGNTVSNGGGEPVVDSPITIAGTASVINGTYTSQIEFAGPISGSDGTSTLVNNLGEIILTGTNTYSNTQNNGRVRIGNNGTTGTLGTGSVTNTGTLTFARSDRVTLDRNLNFEDGMIIVAGGGTLVLPPGISVSAYGLYVGHPDDGTSGTLEIQNGALLNVDGFGMYVGCPMGAAGTVNQYGGTVTTSCDFAYGWSTCLNFGGTYNLNDGTFTGQQELCIGEGKDGTFIQTRGTASFRGIVMAPGAGFLAEMSLIEGVTCIGSQGIQKFSTGTTEITTFNNVIVATADWACDLPITARGHMLRAVFLGTQIDTNGHTITLNGPVTGGGNLWKFGSGTLNLNGNSSLSGLASAIDGLLSVNGSLGAGYGVTVMNGGTLGGAGRVTASVVVESGGTLKPGTDVGSLTIDGSVQFDFGSTLSVDVNGTSSYDQLIVNGDVTFGAGVNIVTTGTYAPPSQSGQTFVILANNGFNPISGGFTSPQTVSINGTTSQALYNYNGSYDLVLKAYTPAPPPRSNNGTNAPAGNSPATANPGTAYVGEMVEFSASGAGQFLWNFGDGTNSNERVTQHAYNAAGTFHIEVSVMDGNRRTVQNLAVVVLPGDNTIEVTSMKIAFDFKTPARSSMAIRGKLLVPATAPALEGMAINVTIGDSKFTRRFVLNDKGIGGDACSQFALSGGASGKANTTARFRLLLKSSAGADDAQPSLFQMLTPLGYLNTTVGKAGAVINVPIKIEIVGSQPQSNFTTVNTRYQAVQGRKGQAVLTK